MLPLPAVRATLDSGAQPRFGVAPAQGPGRGGAAGVKGGWISLGSRDLWQGGSGLWARRWIGGVGRMNLGRHRVSKGVRAVRSSGNTDLRRVNGTLPWANFARSRWSLGVVRAFVFFKCFDRSLDRFITRILSLVRTIGLLEQHSSPVLPVVVERVDKVGLHFDIQSLDCLRCGTFKGIRRVRTVNRGSVCGVGKRCF